ncbi:MAG: repressor LexA [Saprospiraceae bacterium]|jgi:repressor LexA
MARTTQRQQQILDFIKSIITNTGLPPTRSELCIAFGFRSPTAADDHLKALARKGLIELVPGVSRGIKLMQQALTLGLPLIGQVAAGAPILAEENIEEYIELNPSQFKPKADYLLRVRGHSMCDVGILDNDLLAVQRTQEVRDGQIVVARIGDEVTVKRFKRIDNEVILLAENPDFSPIKVDLREADFAIEGLGVGVVRHSLQ